MPLQECIDKEIKSITEYALLVSNGPDVLAEMEGFLRKSLEIAYTRGSTDATAKCVAQLEAMNRKHKLAPAKE